MSRVGLELFINFIFAIGALLFGHHIGHKNGAEEVQASWDAEKAAIVTAQRDKEVALQAGMDKLRMEKNRELARLNTTVQRLSDSLRSRPERPAVPASAADGDAGGWCSGPQLYREDAALVISESERAERIRLALKECYSIYGAASEK